LWGSPSHLLLINRCQYLLLGLHFIWFRSFSHLGVMLPLVIGGQLEQDEVSLC